MKRLIKQIEAAAWGWEDPDPNLWGLIQSGGEYEVLSNSANSISAVALNQYIDLAGMSMREKTMFLEGLRIDYQVPPSGVEAIAGDQIEIYFLVTDIPATTTSFVGPGFANSDLNAENCALMLSHTWTFTTDTASWSSTPQLTSQTSNGMMMATSSDRLYFSVYQVLKTRKVGGATQSTLSRVVVPGVRVVLDMEAKEEPEFQYLMRLRRSYELQQS